MRPTVSILLVECLQIDEHAHKIAHISGSLTPIGTCRFPLSCSNSVMGCGPANHENALA